MPYRRMWPRELRSPARGDEQRTWQHSTSALQRTNGLESDDCAQAVSEEREWNLGERLQLSHQRGGCLGDRGERCFAKAIFPSGRLNQADFKAFRSCVGPPAIGGNSNAGMRKAEQPGERVAPSPRNDYPSARMRVILHDP